MTYKKKVTVLAVLLALLTLVYTASIFFDPRHLDERNARYAWLDERLVPQADRIEIVRDGEAITLSCRNGAWFAVEDAGEFPARQYRIEDLLRILSTEAAYPVRARDAASYERLSLTEEAASRIVVRGGAGAYPLLDLLVGRGDAAGVEINLRKNGDTSEVRSGEDKLTAYIVSPRTSWYNLRLFPDAENNALNAGSVQRLSVYATPAGDTDTADGDVLGGAAVEKLELARDNDAGGWVLNRDAGIALDNPKVESYIRSVLEAEGENFNTEVRPEDPAFNDARIELELDDGSIRTIRAGPKNEQGRRNVAVSGAGYVYVLAGWTADRIFRDADYFKKN
ncbi:MAG: hypothetical protein LBP76_09655 [Treponema sp.]|jgi:hypothetical protein|nr:hypothetical protein [Treponema sp.]